MHAADDPRFGHRHRAAEDVTEVVTWCADCQEERRFESAELEVSEYHSSDLNPLLQDAVHGEPIYRCSRCGRVEADVVSRKGYDYEWRDTGYEVGQWQDEELASGEDGGPPKPTEWDEESAMEPRGRGVHPDRLVSRAEGFTFRKSEE